MDTPQTPRVLAPHLANFQHRIVRILGKVTQLRGETAVIDAGGNVDVILNRVSFFIFHVPRVHVRKSCKR
jgi:replication factor A3